MKTIWKFGLVSHDCKMVMRKGAIVRAVAMQGPTLCVWAEVDTSAPSAVWLFKTFGTGHNLEDGEGLPFIGTVFDGPFVWHVFGAEQ